MKKTVLLLTGLLLFMMSTTEMNAQAESPKKDGDKTKVIEEEDEGPVMFKFEPNYLTSIEKRRLEMARTRQILDTLDISENKRRKLLRDLYKNGLTKRLSKVLVADTKFEDIEE